MGAIATMQQTCTNFIQTLLVFVNINPFLYTNDQFALFDKFNKS